MALSISELKVGSIIKYNSEPYQVLKNRHVQTGRGKAVMQTKLRHLINGSVQEKTFATPEFEWADVEKVKAQYLYSDDTFSHFMLTDTFEQVALNKESLEEQLLYLKENTEVHIMKFEGNPVSVEIPAKVTLMVVETTPGVKGDTATGGTKPATMETGLVVSVPLFITAGEMIKVNSNEGTYVERA